MIYQNIHTIVRRPIIGMDIELPPTSINTSLHEHPSPTQATATAGKSTGNGYASKSPQEELDEELDRILGDDLDNDLDTTNDDLGLDEALDEVLGDAFDMDMPDMTAPASAPPNNTSNTRTLRSERPESTNGISARSLHSGPISLTAMEGTALL
jgi:hypothetical protein